MIKLLFGINKHIILIQSSHLHFNNFLKNLFIYLFFLLNKIILKSFSRYTRMFNYNFLKIKVGVISLCDVYFFVFF